jgi:exonuclease I
MLTRCASACIPKAELGDNAVPVKLVHLNKCPILAQAKTLRPEDAERLGIDRKQCLDNLNVLRNNPQVREKVLAIFAEAEPFVPLRMWIHNFITVFQRRRPCGNEHSAGNRAT